METYVIVALILILLMIWVISTKRKLAVMCENVDNAMSQIGVQLSSRFDALTALLDLTSGYTSHEPYNFTKSIISRRSSITAKSTPSEVLKQEDVISDTLDRISMAAEQYPELKADSIYIRCMDAADSYEKMMRTSRLIYNDSVSKLNRAVRTAPCSLIAGLLGFHQRDYLEAAETRQAL